MGKVVTKDQGDNENNENPKKNWRSILHGVVIEMHLEENDTVVSEVFYSEICKVKIDHKTASRKGEPYYETHKVNESTMLLKIENLKSGDYVIEVHTNYITNIFNVSVNSNFDNPANKIGKIGIATPCSNNKEYLEKLTEAIFNPPMHDDSTVKFSYSNGASSTTMIQKLKEFDEFSAKYFKDNFMGQNLVVFPQFEAINAGADNNYAIDISQQTLVDCFTNSLKRKYTAASKGVVLVAPNIAHLSGIINNTGSAANCNYSKRKCLLVFVEKISLVLVVRIVRERHDINKEISRVQNDVQRFINIHSHIMNEEGLTIAGIIACPSVERKELMNLIPFQFADADIELYKTLFLCKDDIETKLFSKWWEKSISVLNRRLDMPDKPSKGTTFMTIIGQHMVSMATVTESLPTLSCKPHDKLKTLILNKKQLEAINSPSMKKHIVGPFGSGKTLIGQAILKNLKGNLKENGERSTLFYVTCDSYSVVDCHVKSSLEISPDDTVQFVCGSLHELHGKYINQHHSLITLDSLMKGLAEKFPNPHFICDEVQSSVMTEHVAKTIDGYLQTILQQSHVVFIQQSMKKEREYEQQSIEADNFHLINGLELHRLQGVMRMAVEIQKLICSTQEVIANHTLRIEVPKGPSNTSDISPVPRSTTTEYEKVFKEATNSLGDVDKNSKNIKRKISESTFEDLDVSLQILSRSSQNKTAQNALATITSFFKGKEGNKISSEKALLIFLPEASDVDTVKILSFVLSNRCLQKTPVFIANSLQSARLLNRGAKACTKETVVHIPYLQRKPPTTAKKDIVIKEDDSSVLITDYKSFLGMESEAVVSIVDPAEKIMRHSIVEIVSRCTCYLYMFVLPQNKENEPGSMGEIIDKWLEDDLVDTMSVELEMNDDESEPFEMKGKKFIIYTKSDEFKSLSDEINGYDEDEFREHLPDEEISKSLRNRLRDVEGNESKPSIIHEVTYDGRNWSFHDVYELLENKHYTKFGELFQKNRNILNNLRDQHNDNETFLIRAFFFKNLDIIEHLTKHFPDDVDVWAVNSNGLNAYHVATYDHVDVLKLLLSFDQSRLDNRDNHGMTPLHYAADFHNKRIVELLLDAGASVDVVNNRGRTPETCSDDVDIIKMIQRHQKKSTS